MLNNLNNGLISYLNKNISIHPYLDILFEYYILLQCKIYNENGKALEIHMSVNNLKERQ